MAASKPMLVAVTLAPTAAGLTMGLAAKIVESVPVAKAIPAMIAVGSRDRVPVAIVTT
jgi:hypothetical protein